MNEAQLSSLIRPAGKRAGAEASVPVYSVTKYNGFVPSLEYFEKTVFARDVSKYKLVEPGQFAYATIHLDEGSIGIAPERALISPMYTVFALDTSQVVPQYLLRYLKSPRALSAYSLLGQGAVHRRKSISLSALGTLPVPLPSVQEQQRVAQILDRADAVREKRRRQLNRVDTLQLALFWKYTESAKTKVPLKELGIDFQSGKSVVANGMNPHPNNRVLKVSAVSSGTFTAQESKPLPGEYDAPESHLVNEGDILFCRASGSLNLLGATARVSEPVRHLYLPDKVWRLLTSDSSEVRPEYTLGILRSERFLSYLRHNASGAAGVRNIAKSKVLSYEAPFIDRNLQGKYALESQKIASVGTRIRQTIARDHELFDSLQSRAFRGEL